MVQAAKPWLLERSHTEEWGLALDPPATDSPEESEFAETQPGNGALELRAGVRRRYDDEDTFDDVDLDIDDEDDEDDEDDFDDADDFDDDLHDDQ